MSYGEKPPAFCPKPRNCAHPSPQSPPHSPTRLIEHLSGCPILYSLIVKGGLSSKARPHLSRSSVTHPKIHRNRSLHLRRLSIQTEGLIPRLPYRIHRRLLQHQRPAHY